MIVTRLVIAGLLLGVAACYRPGGDPVCQIKCTGNSGCPDGLMCMTSLALGEVCVRYAGQCDELPDDADAMVDLNDEDGDTVDNGTDNCPGVFNPKIGTTQADGDGDGVGDACDPHPGDAKDRIAARVFFDDDDLRGWIPEQTGWTVSDGAVQTPPGAPGVTVTLTYTTEMIEFPTIEAGIDVVQVGPELNDNSVGAHLRFQRDYFCYLREQDPGGAATDLRLLIDNQTPSPDPGFASIAPQLVDGAPLFRFTFKRDPAQAFCTQTIEADEMIVYSQPEAGPLAVVSVAAKVMTVRFRYIVVYSYLP